jgi:hypothetical protein
MRIWTLVLGASLLGAGAVAVACSSSSSSGPSNEDAGADGGEDSGGDGNMCITPDASVATVDSGNPVWACLQMKCATEMQACACDPVCNDAIGMALLQSANDAGAATGLLTMAVYGHTSDPPIVTLGTCLAGASPMCGGPTISDGGEGGTTAGEGGADGGGEAGETTEGGGEGGGDGGGEGGADGGGD